jgi:hypothetical protein
MPYEIGQEVAVVVRGRPERATIERITPTGRYVVKVWGRSVQFSPDGHKIGDSVYAACLQPMTPDLADKIRRVELIARLSAVHWQDLPLATLEAVAAVLQKEG